MIYAGVPPSGKFSFKIELNKGELLFEKVIKDVRKLISYNGEIIMKHDFLWKRAIPQYQLNHEGIVSKIEDFQNKNKNFHITGNYYNGISVSDCIEKAYALSKIL